MVTVYGLTDWDARVAAAQDRALSIDLGGDDVGDDDLSPTRPNRALLVTIDDARSYSRA